MKKRFKRVGAAFLSLAMILGIMPGVTKPIEVLAANSEPTTAYWTEGSSLKTDYNLNGGTKAKIRFGASDREWYIAGVDQMGTNSDTTDDTLAFLSTSQFQTGTYGEDSRYSDTANNFFKTGGYFEKYLNKDTNTYFSDAEIDRMQTITVSTLEYDQANDDTAKTATGKLYIPDSASRTSVGSSVNTIYVGTNNDIPISLTNLNVSTEHNCFWLRSPDSTHGSNALVASPGGGVDNLFVSDSNVSVVPAFNLNLSSVIFASAASAASSSYIGDKANSAMTANTYTLRYASNGSEAAVFSADDTSVQVSGASLGMYLMVQNSNGVYIEDASTNPLVNASSIIINGTALTDFDNCEMWLESTTDRITTAKIIKTNHVNTENQTANFSACNHDYEWDVEREPTETEDGEAVYKCTKCGNISARQPLTAYQYYILTSTNKIKNAKAGSTVTISSKLWNSFPKSFFEQLAKKRDITVKIDFPYDSKNYEITISPTQKIDTSNSKVKYYGPKNLIGTYNAVEVKAK